MTFYLSRVAGLQPATVNASKDLSTIRCYPQVTKIGNMHMKLRFASLSTFPASSMSPVSKQLLRPKSIACLGIVNVICLLRFVHYLYKYVELTSSKAGFSDESVDQGWFGLGRVVHEPVDTVTPRSPDYCTHCGQAYEEYFRAVLMNQSLKKVVCITRSHFEKTFEATRSPSSLPLWIERWPLKD